MSRFGLFTLLLLTLLVAAGAQARSMPDSHTPMVVAEIETLIHLRKRVKLLLALNQANLQKHIQSHQEAGNELATENERSRKRDLTNLRVYQSLQSLPIPKFKDQGLWDFMRHPEERTISRTLEHPLGETELAPLSNDEFDQAKKILTNRLTGACARFEKATPQIAEHFCERFSAADESSLLRDPLGQVTLKGFFQFFQSDYEFSFRPYVERRYRSLLSNHPELLTVRGPETIAEDLLPSYRRILEKARQMSEELEESEREFGLDTRIETFRRGYRDGRYLTRLKNYLTEYFRFVVDSDSFHSMDPTYERLLTEYKTAESRHFLALSAVVFALNVACLTPAGKGAVPAVSWLGKAWGFLRAGKGRWACIGALYVPINLTLIASSYQEYARLEELFLTARGETDLYVELSKVSEKKRVWILSMVLASMDPFVIFKAIQ